MSFTAWQHHRLLTESAVFHSTVWNSHHFFHVEIWKVSWKTKCNLIQNKRLLQIIPSIRDEWLKLVDSIKNYLAPVFWLYFYNFTNLCLEMVLKATIIVCISLFQIICCLKHFIKRWEMKKVCSLLPYHYCQPHPINSYYTICLFMNLHRNRPLIYNVWYD